MNRNSEKSDYVAYEYKDIHVKRDFAALYEDCYKSFGWTLTQQREHGVFMAGSDYLPVGVPHIAVDTSRPADLDIVTLKFKRDSCLPDKHKLNILQSKCDDALTAIDKLQKKGAAQSMGVSLGIGIVGTAFLALAVYNFIAASIPLGVVFAIAGAAGWGIGFLANGRISRKQKAETIPLVQQQMEVVYGACEQAHAILA